MPESTIERRVESLEKSMDRLMDVPGRLDRVEGGIGHELRNEIRAGDEETRALMRVLHAELKAEIKLVAEAWKRR